MRYVIVITAPDGTVSVCGTFADEYRAVVAANRIETEESGLVGSVHEVESAASVLAGLADGGD